MDYKKCILFDGWVEYNVMYLITKLCIEINAFNYIEKLGCNKLDTVVRRCPIRIIG